MTSSNVAQHRRRETPHPARHAVGADAQLVGREVELELIRTTIGRTGAVVLVGASGIGKTTLLQRAIAGRPASIGGGLGLLQAVPYLPITRAVGSVPDGDPALVAREVVRRVGSAGVLVLDDLQWTDDATLGLLDRLVGRIAILGATRTEDRRSERVLRSLRALGLIELAIEPLGHGDASALVRRLRPDLGIAATRAVLHGAAGNPLLLEELARDGVTTSLRFALGHRIRNLPAPAVDWLELLAIADEPLPIPTDRPGLDVLVRAGFATITGATMGIRHALIAEIVVEMLPVERREALHRMAAGLVRDPAAVARHLAASGDRAGAFEVATRAAAACPAGSRVALLGLAAECADGPGAASLRLKAAEAQADAGFATEAGRLLTLLVPADDAAGARWHLIRSRTRWEVGDGDGALADAETGRRMVAGDGTALEAMLLVQEAWVVTLRREGPRAVQLARDALATTRSLGLAEASAKRVLATAMSVNGAPMSAWIDLLESALDEARRTDDVTEELVCGKILVSGHEGSGDAAEGRRIGESLVARAIETGMAAWEQSIRATLLSLANGQGEFRHVVDAADDLLLEPLNSRVRSQTSGYRALALVELGRFEEAGASIAAGLAAAADDADARFDLLAAQAELSLETGDLVRALDDADTCIERFAQAAYGDIVSMRIVRAWACLGLGRDPGEPIPPSIEIHPVWVGTIEESAAIGLLATGRPDEAAESFHAAATDYSALMRRGEIRCRWAEGEALRRAGRLEEAVRVLEEAEGRAEALGMAPMAGRIRRSLRLAGSHRSAPHASAGRLSAREREVLHLVGLGLTNIEIARRMGLGRPTVSRTLSNAMAKLGADSRGQAVALAAEVD